MESAPMTKSGENECLLTSSELESEAPLKNSRFSAVCCTRKPVVRVTEHNRPEEEEESRGGELRSSLFRSAGASE